MRRTKELQWSRYLLTGMAAIGLAVLLILFSNVFSIVSHAESAATVTAASVNIRREPNASSETIGSTERDKVISIRSQVQGADGYTWYEVYVDANTLGYIRSDLVQITDGTTPPAGTAPTASSTAPSTSAPAAEIPDEPVVDVTAVNPASASVTGGKSIRIRQNASTTSRIISSVTNGTALTITGMATGTDGNIWYLVSYNADGAEVTGFIRSDYTTANADELIPYVEEPPVVDPGFTEEPSYEEPAPVETDPYTVLLQNGEWVLVDYEGRHGEPDHFYTIQSLFDGVEQNATLLEKSEATVKNQKIIVILLVIVLVGAAAAITLLIFKVKDMADAQYFNEVENETLKRRSTRAQGSGQKVMQTVGGEKQGGRTASQGQRPQGGRPAAASQNQRSQGGRPAAASQGQRPQGSRPAAASQGQRPQGSRPAEAPQGQRPQGGRPAEAPQGQRPQGGRPAGAPQGQRSQSQQPQMSQNQSRPTAQGTRPSGLTQGQPRPAAQGQRPQGNRPAQSQQSPGWQAKNFMTADDDDEFEFEFLNYDGDDEK